MAVGRAATSALKRIASFFNIGEDEAATLASRYGENVDLIKQARDAGDYERAYEMSRSAGSFGEDIPDAASAREALTLFTSDPGYSQYLTADDLLDMGDDFTAYFTAYRRSVTEPGTQQQLRSGAELSKGGGKKNLRLNPRFQETGEANLLGQEMAGVQPFTGNPTEMMITAALENNPRRFAEAMAQRMSNQMALTNRLELEAAAVAQRVGVDPSTFYGTGGDMHGFISKVTGIPRPMVSAAMAVASAGSSPYDELLKLAAVAPYIRKRPRGKGVFYDVDAATADGAFVRKVEGDALANAMNGLDPTIDNFPGLKLKTEGYRRSHFGPEARQNLFISDRIAQRQSAGAINEYDNTQGDPYVASGDWVGGRAIAAAEGIQPAVPQEMNWWAQRVFEILAPSSQNKRRMASQSFPFSGPEIEGLFSGGRVLRMLGDEAVDLSDISVEGKRIGRSFRPTGRRIDPDVLAEAQQYSNVGMPRAGESAFEEIIPPSMRKKLPQLEDLVLAGQNLGDALGPVVRSKRGFTTPEFAALAALIGAGGLGAGYAGMGQETPPAPGPYRPNMRALSQMGGM